MTGHGECHRKPTRVDVNSLSKQERLTLLDEIWDSLTPEEVPFTEAQRADLERRIIELEHDPDQGIPWQEARRRIQSRST